MHAARKTQKRIR